MRLTTFLRAGTAALALMGAAALDNPAYAQTGEPAGDATGIARAVNTGTMNSLFPQTVAAVPAPQGAGAGAAASFADRVKTRDTNFPDRSGKTLINVGTPYVNAIFGGLGEGAGLAGGLEFTTADALGEQFDLYADAVVSTRLYRQFEVGANIGHEKDRGEVRYIYTRRTRDNFFGLGPFADEDPIAFSLFGEQFVLGGETNYQRETRTFQAGYAHYFVEDKFSVGAYVDYTSTSIYEGKDDADPSIFSVYSPYPALGGFDAPLGYLNQVPGLTGNSKIFTYGAYSEADFRTNDKGLTQGFYGYVRYSGHDGVDDDNVFGGYGWNQFSADVRGYIPIFSDKTSIALRFWSDDNFRRGGSAIPFYDLARLGGGSSLRGFDTFRFYGEKSVLFQGEFRQTVYNFGGDKDKGIDINLFGDAGQVWGLGFDENLSTPFPVFENSAYDYDSGRYEADLGFGATVRISKAFALRLDYAHSNETDKVKLAFTRGF